jgi:hypothetical protein
MIVVVEDDTKKLNLLLAALKRDAGGEVVRVSRAIDWTSYQEKLREHAGQLTAVCLDFTGFPGGNSAPKQTDADLRAEAARLHAAGVRVVMWSDAARPDRVPRGVLCVGAVTAVRSTADFLRGRPLPDPLPEAVGWGTWEPAPALADLVALDLLSQGYLAIAGASCQADEVANEVVESLRDAGPLGAECLAEAARPESQAQIADPRVWFAPAREAIARGGRSPQELWPALSDDPDAVGPIRRLFEALTDSVTRPATEWHQLVAGAAAGFRRIADRREL